MIAAIPATNPFVFIVANDPTTMATPNPMIASPINPRAVTTELVPVVELKGCDEVVVGVGVGVGAVLPADTLIQYALAAVVLLSNAPLAFSRIL